MSPRTRHASWLLAGGADLEVVKERLGYSSIVTTQKYLGTLDETDETAIEALSRIRNRSTAVRGKPVRRPRVNPRTRRAALYAIGVIAILASANALTHSYAGLYDWAVHHSLAGWQAMSWPAEIDVFLAVGELALYVAYLDGWPARQRIWPWVTALMGLCVSVAGNIGHIQPGPGHPVILADRLTAATSPVAAFAGLAVGLLVLKMTRQQASHEQPASAARQPSAEGTPDPLLGLASVPALAPAAGSPEAPPDCGSERRRGSAAKQATGAGSPSRRQAGAGTDRDLLREASLIFQAAAASGEPISQRAYAEAKYWFRHLVGRLPGRLRGRV